MTGEALGKISEFFKNPDLYPQAWEALLESYDQKRLLVVKHLDAIFNLPIIPNKFVATDLSNLIDKTKQHLHLLSRLGVKMDDLVAIRIMERHLAKYIKNKWEETLDANKLPTLAEFYTFLKNTVFRLRSSQQPQPSLSEGESRKCAGEVVSQPKAKSSKTSARYFVTASTSSSSSYTPSSTCPKCNDFHRLFKCPLFHKLSTQERAPQTL